MTDPIAEDYDYLLKSAPAELQLAWAAMTREERAASRQAFFAEEEWARTPHREGVEATTNLITAWLRAASSLFEPQQFTSAALGLMVELQFELPRLVGAVRRHLLQMPPGAERAALENALDEQAGVFEQVRDRLVSRLE